MSFWVLLILTIALTSALDCPNECRCSSNAVGSSAVCHTVDPVHTVSSLDYNTTHLLMTYLNKFVEDGYPTFDVSFFHLKKLQVLLLDTAGLYSFAKVRINQTSFPKESTLRVLNSRVRLDFTPDTFANMLLMESLTLTNTVQTWEQFPQIMNESLCHMQRLLKLDLTRFSPEYATAIQQNFTPSEIFRGCHIPSLKELILKDNAIEKVLYGIHVPFNNLSVLDLSYNVLTRTQFYTQREGFEALLEMIGYLPLHTFDIGNQLTSFESEDPLGEKDLHKPVEYPRPSTHFDLSKNEYYLVKLALTVNLNNSFNAIQNLRITVEKLVLPNLQGSLNFGIVIYGKPNFGLVLPPLNVRYLDCSNNAFLRWQKTSEWGKVDAFSSLSYLNLQLNGISDFHPMFLGDCKALETLLLGHNNLADFLPKLNVRENQHLKVLDLAYNNITLLPHKLLVGVSSLRQLNLTGNKIVNFSIDLTTLVNLNLVNLTNNRIQTLSSSMTSMLDEIVKNQFYPPKVDLLRNPLSCACANIPFIAWLLTTNVVIAHREQLTCNDSFNGHYTLGSLDLKDLRSKCYPDTAQVIILSVTLTIVVIAFVSAMILIYCKRWKLRYWWYITKKGWKQLVYDQDMTQYEFDAFVSYDFDDFPWVKHELLVEMEQKRNFKLCVAHRDFNCGEILHETIVDHIDKSRKTILLLTPEFIKSPWCEFEFSIAMHKRVDSGKDVIVAVILKPLQAGSVRGSLYQVLKNKLYLEWVEDDDTARALFWRKLNDVLLMPQVDAMQM